MKDPEVTEQLARDHGLSDHEAKLMIEILGRVPTYPELGIFSVMWSEHCSYKSSKKLLQTLPTTGACVIQGPGENAGVVDIGFGNVCVFKIESHNHPSYVEPHAGAATGVGGILRDIFTMGARPLASLDSLRFGPLDDPQQRYLVRGVVAGVGSYGNCFGCATVGGEVTFHPRYRRNILVNAMNIGIARADAIFLAKAAGVGNPVIYVGSKTGRDGIHGASLLASSEFDEHTEEMRPTVQMGDPFTEKLLLEACLEAMQTGAIVGIQDMGAAGLTCSSFEMASRSGTGIEMDLDRVPQRESEMTPYELLLSESQERMLLVAEAGREREILDVFAKWDLDAALVGRVTDDGRMRVRWHGRTVVDIPVDPIAASSPVYERPRSRPADFEARQRLDLAALPVERDPSGALLALLASPNLCSREWVYRQYDQLVQSSTVLRPGGDAAVVRVPETERGLAAKTDCNPRYCAQDPYLGAMHAVAEASRNVAVTGARPLAATNCLNFGSPERPECMWEFAEAVRGMGEACRALGVPIVSGNVSFYNETAGEGAIPPTPTVGVIGLLDDVARAVPAAFRAEGDVVLLFGETRAELGASEYLAVRHGLECGAPPALDLAAEKRLHELLVEAAAAGLLRSAHDCAEGGAAIALAECAIRSGLGVVAELAEQGGRPELVLFSESASRAIASCAPADAEALLALARAREVAAARIGRVGGDRIRIAPGVDVSLAEAHDVWSRTLPEALG
ncbi:MAG: phosphoribosylformylglycinamidine synthase subunit PurL [Deltaproteobacteria bacterium]|nr:phosphoribosylformylglycinamidine synthase subunit PurL [Deltaproteobacteria bacterium]